MNDVQDLNPLRFDTVYDEISAMLQISVNTCFSRDETTNGMMMVVGRKLVDLLVEFLYEYRSGRIGESFKTVSVNVFQTFDSQIADDYRANLDFHSAIFCFKSCIE